MNAMEIRSLRRICEVSYLIETAMNRKAGASEDLTVRMKRNVLNWFGHVERKNDERIAKKIYDGEMSSKRGRGRPQLTFKNTVPKNKDPPESMYEEIDDSGRGERGIQRP